MKKNIVTYHKELKQKKYKFNCVDFRFPKKLIYIWQHNLNDVAILFSYLIKKLKPEYIQYLPYKVTVKKLVNKNQFTTGQYVAVNKNNGTLDLHLAFEKIPPGDDFFSSGAGYKLVWVLAHEFRHKIQLNDERIQTVLDYPNWENFNIFMQNKFNQSQDTIDHVFHELNPAEVDANIFACELTGIKFNGTKFDINNDLLKLLKKKQNFKNAKG
jgi:hypothetical protein